VLNDATALLVLRGLHALLLFVTSAVVSRGLGPQGRGLYYTPLLAATTTIALCHLGLDQTNVYLFGTRRAALHKLVGQAGMVALVSGIVGGLGLVAFAAVVPSFFAGIPLQATVVAALLVPVGLHAIFSTGLLTVQGRVKAPLLASIGGAVFQLVALAGLRLSGMFTPWPVFGTYALSIVMTFAALAAMLSSPRKLIAWDVPLLRESLRHSLVLHVGMALLFLTLRVDMFLVRGMLGVQALGLYSLAVALAETVMLATDSLSIALVPRQMSGTVREAAATALAGARMIALIGLALGIAWTIAGSIVLKVFFGAAFQPVYAPMLVLIPGIVVISMQRVCGAPVLRTGRPWKITGLMATAFIVNLLLNLWWIPRFGLVGASAASTISYCVSAVGFIAWTGRLAGESPAMAIPRAADLRRLTATVLGLRDSFRRGSQPPVMEGFDPPLPRI
jgi:O-antigen/teichoic acid export membrane protein